MKKYTEADLIQFLLEEVAYNKRNFSSDPLASLILSINNSYVKLAIELEYIRVVRDYIPDNTTDTNGIYGSWNRFEFTQKGFDIIMPLFEL